MSLAVDQLIEQVKALAPNDRKRLRAVLDQPDEPVRQQPATEEDFQRWLVEEGMLDALQRPERDQAAFDQFQPIAIQGRPLSELIIEERR